jgi:hypothetical protein
VITDSPGPNWIRIDKGSNIANCAAFNLPEPDVWTSEFHWMKGFLITQASANGTGPQTTQATAGDQLLLQARVYNYSLTDMANGTTAVVRFYKSAFYIAPKQSQATPVTNAQRREARRKHRPPLAVEQVHVSTRDAELSEKVRVDVRLRAGDAALDGVTVFYYDGEPGQGWQGVRRRAHQPHPRRRGIPRPRPVPPEHVRSAHAVRGRASSNGERPDDAQGTQTRLPRPRERRPARR